MKINDLINKDTIIVDFKAATKKGLLEGLSTIIAEKYNINATNVADVILERENLGSTGMGKGIAIPHGRVDDITKPVGMLIKLAEPMEFDAVDDELVDIVFLLLAPSSSGADHLNALSAVSSVLKNVENREAIRAAKSVDEIASLLEI